MQENIEEYYKQILYSNEYLIVEKSPIFKINFSSRLYLFLCIYLILISQSNALPMPQSKFRFTKKNIYV